MMEIRTLGPDEKITEAVYLGPDCCSLIWKRRPLAHFVDAKTCARWNGRFAGKMAGSDDGRGYLYFRLNGRKTYVHRVIWLFCYGSPVPSEIDHIDGNPSNNHPTNLRAADRSGNNSNVRSAKGSSSQFLGVHWSTKDRRWVAQIEKARKKTLLGYFRDEVEAARAYDAAARRVHGTFARPNFPNGVTNAA